MIVGITGGIASGKTYCAGVFESIGVPIYYADHRAKLIMVENEEVINAVTALFGHDSYFSDGSLNRKHLSAQIFNNKELLKRMNAIVHPAVRNDFFMWGQSELRNSPYIIQESALAVETGSYKMMDKLIVVDAPEEERIRRVLKRDSATEEQVKSRMKNQLPSSEKRKVADYIIDNYKDPKIISKVLAIHFDLIQQIHRSQVS
jgi:dephospho-CoA kinase